MPMIQPASGPSARNRASIWSIPWIAGWPARRSFFGIRLVVCRPSILAIAVLAGVALGGCGIDIQLKRTRENRARLEVPPQVLLSAYPFRRLVVEVDRVAGCEPDREALAVLVDVIRSHCHKPDGVRLVVDDEIPAAEARFATPSDLFALAARWRNIEVGPRTAHLHVLYVPHVPAAIGREESDVPLILIGAENVRRAAWFWMSRFVAERVMLVHGLGHTLGLVAEHHHQAAGAHCSRPSCVMYPRVLDWRRVLADPAGFFLFSIRRRFCGDCVEELERRRERPMRERIRFVPGGARREPLFDPRYEVLLTNDPRRIDVRARARRDAAYYEAALGDYSPGVRFVAARQLIAHPPGIGAAAELLSRLLASRTRQWVRVRILALLAAECAGAGRKTALQMLSRRPLADTIADLIRSDASEAVRLAACRLALRMSRGVRATGARLPPSLRAALTHVASKEGAARLRAAASAALSG